MNGALRRYQILANIVGVLLIPVYLFIIPGVVGSHSTWKAVYPLHGFIFIAYCFQAFELSVRARIPLGRLAVMVIAGLLPFVTFYVEKRVTRLVRERMALQEAAAAPSA